jgi:hypothetical protein
MTWIVAYEGKSTNRPLRDLALSAIRVPAEHPPNSCGILPSHLHRTKAARTAWPPTPRSDRRGLRFSCAELGKFVG